MSAAAAARPHLPATDNRGPGRLARTWRSIDAVLGLWHRRLRERQELARLSDRDLYDFGASRSDAIAELRKPFWRK